VLTQSGVSAYVTDCTLTVSAGTLTLAAGTFNQSATLTGASVDKLLILAVPGTPTQFNFLPQNGKILMQVNTFGFVPKASGTAPDGSSLACSA
jgi:hypothetical protein